MQSRNWIMLKMFLSAVATGAVVPAFLNGFGSSSCAPPKAVLYAADIVGGLILGKGSETGSQPHRRLAPAE